MENAMNKTFPPLKATFKQKKLEGSFQNCSRASRYKFYLKTIEDNNLIELAVCADSMTADFLADHFRNLYQDKNKFELFFKSGRVLRNL